jgi:hypothetical protein
MRDTMRNNMRDTMRNNMRDNMRDTMRLDKHTRTCVCLYCGTMISLGLLIGWGVSMVTTCGTFDVNGYTLNMMIAGNCTVPATTPHCSDMYHDVRRSANDLALQQCFIYCWNGMIYGLLFAFTTLVFAVCATHRHWIHAQCRRCLNYTNTDKVTYEIHSPRPLPEVTYEVDYVKF